METKIVYQTNELGYLIGTIELNVKEDQSRSGMWLIPAWCVEKKPIKEKEGYRLRWLDEKWINELIPESEKEPELTLEEKKALKAAELKATRDQKESGGFWYEGKVFDSDQAAYNRIVGQSKRAELDETKETYFWITQDNTIMVLSREEMIRLPIYLAEHAENQHMIYAQLKIALSEVATEEQLELIKWPEE